MTEITVAKTCSTCKFSKWTTTWNKGKKQMGICMLHTEGEEPVLPSEGTLYTHVVTHKEMKDVHEYVTVLWAYHYGEKLDRHDMLKYRARSGDGYNPKCLYGKENVLATIHKNDNLHSSYFEGYEEITKEEYMLRYAELAEEFDPFKEAEWSLQSATETWHKFNDNFVWWQENKDKMRRCHRNTTCASHVYEPKREPIAKAVANGKHKLEWLE
jgi:hypothetical protein